MRDKNVIETSNDEKNLILRLLEKYFIECDTEKTNTKAMYDLEAKKECINFWETEKEKAHHLYTSLQNY